MCLGVMSQRNNDADITIRPSSVSTDEAQRITVQEIKLGETDELTAQLYEMKRKTLTALNTNTHAHKLYQTGDTANCLTVSSAYKLDRFIVQNTIKQRKHAPDGVFHKPIDTQTHRIKDKDTYKHLRNQADRKSVV